MLQLSSDVFSLMGIRDVISFLCTSLSVYVLNFVSVLYFILCLFLMF